MQTTSLLLKEFMLLTKTYQSILRGLATAFLIAVANPLFSQSYYNSPNDTLISFTPLNSWAVLNITQVHPGQDTLLFHWEKLTDTTPIEWFAYICDNGACFPSLIDSGTMIPIVPGDNGLMSVHVKPLTVYGTATIRYLLYDVNSGLAPDTLTWIVTADTISGISDLPASNPDFHIIGNELILTDISPLFSEIKIHDVRGSLLFSTEINPYTYRLTLPASLPSLLLISICGKEIVISKKIIYQK